MTALIVIDMQAFFAAEAKPVLSTVNTLIDHFHAAAARNPGSAVVVYTQHGQTPAQLNGTETSQLVRFWGADRLIHRFEPGWELLPALSKPLLPPQSQDNNRPQAGDVLVQDKDTYDAFLHTGLEETLRARGVQRVVISGVLTNYCCETTARSAFNRGFETYFVSDACGASSSNPTLHENTLQAIRVGFGEVLTASELLARWDTFADE